MNEKTVVIACWSLLALAVVIWIIWSVRRRIAAERLADHNEAESRKERFRATMESIRARPFPASGPDAPLRRRHHTTPDRTPPADTRSAIAADDSPNLIDLLQRGAATPPADWAPESLKRPESYWVQDPMSAPAERDTSPGPVADYSSSDCSSSSSDSSSSSCGGSSD